MFEMTDTQVSIFNRVAKQIYAYGLATDNDLQKKEELKNQINNLVKTVHNKEEENYLIHLIKNLDFSSRTKLKTETKEIIKKAIMNN